MHVRQTSAHRQLYISLCGLCTTCMYVCLCWGAIINFSSFPTSIISISQSSLSCWGASKTRVAGWVGSYWGTGKTQPIKHLSPFSWSRQEGSQMFYCLARLSPHIFAAELVMKIYQRLPCLSLISHTHKHAHKMKTERIVSQFISSTSTARQTWQIKEQNSGAAVKIICAQKVLNNSTWNNKLKSKTAISS